VSPRLAVLHHLEQPFLGTLEAPLREAGLELDERRPGDPLPALDEVDGLLSLGGGQSAVDLDAEPALREEAGLLRSAVDAGVPVLGVCLGAQLLAAACGARVFRARRRTVAWLALPVTESGRSDLVGRALPDPVWGLHWNEDAFELPPGGVELLERAGGGVEAFRVGARAWGVQFHPDVDAAALDDWYARYGDWLAQAGVTEADARAADARHLPGQQELADRLCRAFAEVVTGARDCRKR